VDDLDDKRQKGNISRQLMVGYLNFPVYFFECLIQILEKLCIICSFDYPIIISNKCFSFFIRINVLRFFKLLDCPAVVIQITRL
jgi:hypothetical protein